jgi:hypothetical protein
VPILASVFWLGKLRLQFGADDRLPSAHVGFTSTALIVSAARLPGHATAGGYCGNALVSKRWIGSRIRAQNRRFRRRNDDLDGSAKAVREQVTGRGAIIGTIRDEPGHIPANLVKQFGQGGRITHIVRWLAQQGLDRASGEMFLRMLVASGLEADDCQTMLAALATPGGYNIGLRQSVERSGLEEALIAGLNDLKFEDDNKMEIS